MAERSVGLLAVLGELERSERKLHEIYRYALRLSTYGILTEEIRSNVHSLRDRVCGLEQALYRTLDSLVRPISESVADEIPEPECLPDLPTANYGTGTKAAVAVPPVVIWAAVALYAIVAAAAVATIALTWSITVEAAREFFRLRADSDRYEIWFRGAIQQIDRCIARGVPPEECAQYAKILPVPPQAQLPVDPNKKTAWEWALIVGSGVAILGGLAWAYMHFRGRPGVRGQGPYRTPRRGTQGAFSEPLKTTRLRAQGGLRARPKALGAGYDMEVR